MPSIPQSELQTYLTVVMDALDLANEGDTLDGFRCLCAGVDRAREIAEGQEWGPALVEKYEGALLRYAEVRGLKME